MIPNQTPVPQQNTFSARLGRLQRALIEPAAALDDVTLRRKSRLLAILLLTLIALFLLVDSARFLTTPGYRPPWYGYLFLGTAYMLNRTRWYRQAAGLTIAMFPLVILTTILNNPAHGLDNIINYLVLSVFLASIFLSWRGLAILAALNCAGLLLLPFLIPTAVPTYARIVTPLAVNTIGAALALIFMRHRDQLERDRQAELRMSAERLRLALDAARMGTWDWDVQADTVTWSEHVARLFGLRAGALVGTYAAYLARIHPADRAAVEDTIAATLGGAGSDHRVAHRVLWPDGSLHWLEGKGRVYRDDTGRPVRMAGTVMDITVRKQAEAEREYAEAALRDSEERYRVISELVSDYAFAYQVTPEGTLALDWITDAYTRITGYTIEEMHTAEHSAAIVHPDDRPIADQRHQRLLAGQSAVCEYRVVAKDGRILWLRHYDRPVWDATAGRVVRGYGAVQDITKIKQLEQQLTQAQKMEAIGQLAGGIAHDFNNLLTVILGSVDMLLAALTDGHALRQDAEQIRQTAKRAAALTRQLLAFSRQQVLESRRLDLNTVVTSMGQLLSRLIGEDIDLVMKLEPDLGQVHADPGQLEQVIMNLAINARDAMPTGGTLTIETANIAFHDAYVREHIGVERGTYIMFTISDTGLGMDAATRAHIFEPFYTTKAVDRGTGLGLATVHGIVTQSGGHIWVYSEPGHGTTFKIYLPRVDAAGELSCDVDPVTQVSHGDATILLVEDEPMVRALAGRVLRGYGYHILEAEDGPTALRIAAAHQGPIHLLLTDAILPGGMSGRQLAEQVVAQRPTIKVIYMSGYSDTVLTRTIFDPGQAFVQKPFTPDALARKVGEIIQV
jgi:two-component system cell cycle sensor histidine kinase/response regulator CckA